MSLAKLNRHTWKEYEYKYANDNLTPRKMWMRDNDRILQIEDNMFATGNSSHVFEGSYNTFDEAAKMLDAAND